MKNLFKTMFVILFFLMFSPEVKAFDDEVFNNPTPNQMTTYTLIVGLLGKGKESNDAVFYMAAGKLFDDLGPLSILKDAAKKDHAEYTHIDFWSAKDVFLKVIEIAGAKSEMGMQADKLAANSKDETNAEICMGYKHYHLYWHDHKGNVGAKWDWRMTQPGWHRHGVIHNC